jgi:hypothetical protein
MTTDLVLACIRDGRPSCEQHHYREHDATQGKGMGGTHEHVEEVPLCRECHDAIHRKEWTFKVDKETGLVRGLLKPESTMPLFERGLVLDDGSEDMRFWSEEKLCQEYATCNDRAADDYQVQCYIVYAMYRRRAWDVMGWHHRAAEAIQRHTGHSTHWRGVYKRLQDYDTWHDKWELRDELPRTVSRAVADSDNPDKALLIAQEGKDTGRRAGDIVNEIAGIADRAMCESVCETCGYESVHRSRKEA